MKVYRIEDIETGEGPFRGKWEDIIPQSWWDSHQPPHAEDSRDYKLFRNWRKDSELPLFGLLPKGYRFAFTTVEQVITCFPGFETIEGLVLKEYTIKVIDPSSFCKLSDGQIVFSVVISSNILDI